MICKACGEQPEEKFGYLHGKLRTTCNPCRAKRERDRRETPTGRANYRKACQKYYAKNIEFFAEKTARYFRENPGYMKDYRGKHPVEAAARHMVNAAIGTGKLVRPDSCEACGQEAKIQAHHDDYSRPHDVRWLCVPCHAEHHRLERLRTVG